MARRPRLFVADVPCHIIQRGNNKNSIFLKDDDCLFFLNTLLEAKIKYPCLVYSYCLMANHFHLLVEPKYDKNNVSMIVKFLGAKYVGYFNKRYKRSGTLWEGRFRCSLIDKEPYFLTCLRYIEMNPLRAGIVNNPGFYRWSSYRFRAFGEENPIIDLDLWYNCLASNPEGRQLKYRQFFESSIKEPEWRQVREITNKNGILGSSKFKNYIEKLTNQRIVLRPCGRPKKISSDPI